MAKKIMFTENQRNLIKRYLTWCYKTTKEELDKIDRYFTQLKVDAFMLESLRQSPEYKDKARFQEYKNKVDDFKKYTGLKEKKVLAQKFKDKKKEIVSADYLYLKNRFEAIEKAITHFLGKKELTFIRDLYEEEMTLRIIESREHA